MDGVLTGYRCGCVWTGMRVTSVCTRHFLWVWMCLRKPMMLTEPSFWICVSMLSRTMYVPVRPTPALRGKENIRVKNIYSAANENEIFNSFWQFPPAVNHQWPHVICPGSGRLADEAEERQSQVWNASVRPLGVMILCHSPLISPFLGPPLLRTLQVDKNKAVSNRKIPTVTHWHHSSCEILTCAIHGWIYCGTATLK